MDHVISADKRIDRAYFTYYAQGSLADLNVYRHYRSPQGPELSLYIGYYGTAKGGRTGHNPYACLPGAGWKIPMTKEMIQEFACEVLELLPAYWPVEG